MSKFYKNEIWFLVFLVLVQQIKTEEKRIEAIKM